MRIYAHVCSADALLLSQMYSPPLLSVSPGTPIPFLLRLIVRAKASADATAIVPALPLDGSGAGPAFTVKRLVRNQSKKSKPGRTKLDFTEKLPVHVDWSRAHLVGNAATSSTSGTAGPGHGWTSCSHDCNAASFPYSTTALISGLLFFSLSSSFELPTLSVTYTLHLSIPLGGRHNNLDEQLCVVRASSGVTAAELASLTATEATRRAIGSHRASLLQMLSSAQGTQRLNEIALLSKSANEGGESRCGDSDRPASVEEHAQDLPQYEEAVDGLSKLHVADEKHCELHRH